MEVWRSVPLELSDLWTYFAEHECGEYSRLYARICETVAADAAVLDLIRDAPPTSHQPNVLLAAVHYLLLGGLDHPLAAVYVGDSDADAGPLFVDVCLSHREEILALLATRHTNTNEVGRSAVIGPALTAVSQRLGAPLGLVDVGCSAGLNLFCDSYLLDYGVLGTTGPMDAGVRIESEIVGGDAPIAPQLPEIRVRVGLDRDPMDLTVDDNARWLLACIWPDTGRVPRARAAIAAAQLAPPDLVQGDAVDDIAAVVLGLPAEVTPVVVTTWVLAYLPLPRRVSFYETLAAASRTRPIAWVSAEGVGVVDAFAGITPPIDGNRTDASLLGLVTFRDGVGVPELLGFVQPHGAWIDWRAPVS